MAAPATMELVYSPRHAGLPERRRAAAAIRKFGQHRIV